MDRTFAVYRICDEAEIKRMEKLYEEGKCLGSALAGMYYEYAAKCYFEGELEDSFCYCRKAIELGEKADGDGSNFDKQAAYRLFASVLSDQGDGKQAIVYYKKAVDLMEKENEDGKNPGSTLAYTYRKLAEELIRQGDPKQAVLYCQKAIITWTKCSFFDLRSFERSNDLAETYRLLADLMYFEKNFDEAIFYYNKALEIREKLYAESRINAQDLSVVYNNLAVSMKAKGDDQKAFYYFNKTCEILETLHEKGKLSNSAVLRRTYNRMIDILENQVCQYREKIRKLRLSD